MTVNHSVPITRVPGRIRTDGEHQHLNPIHEVVRCCTLQHITQCGLAYIHLMEKTRQWPLSEATPS